MKKITELVINPEKKFIEVVETGRASSQTLANKMFSNPSIIFVGWQLHYVIESGDTSILNSIGGYSEGFKKEDYEE